MASKHTFALHTHSLATSLKKKVNGQIVLTDQILYHRIIRILRLTDGETVTLFDQSEHAQISIVSRAKQHIDVELLERIPNKILQPTIAVYLPMLKKEALEDAVYSCTELGATAIHLVQTEKIQRSWTAKDADRLYNIIIAAAEQSKQFCLPEVYDLVTLPQALSFVAPSSTLAVCAHMNGASLLDILQKIKHNAPQHVRLFFGPEGDFTLQETELLQQHAVNMIRLTPTTLRSQQALALLLGAIRSV
jgi:16S rRNA (uracil1498-N3)-methyltransferase